MPIRRLTAPLSVVALAMVAGAMVPVAAPAPACAGESPHAVLVIDTGEAVVRYCVALPDDSVSGMELIQLAGEQHGLSYRLGYGGKAVCMLAEVGARGTDCFQSHPDFWAYWRADASGQWTWSSSGAAISSVGDGDVEGWSWGSGDGPEAHPSPPPTAFETVCRAAPSPTPEESQTPDVEPARTPQPTPSSSPSASPDEREFQEKKKKRKRNRQHPQPTPSPTPVPSPSRAAPSPATAPASDSGPPAAGVTGLVAAGVLVVAGAVLVRRWPRPRRRR
jgi:hypothetical protein